MTRLFVTGTDTGVGKTTVSVGLLSAAVGAGLKVAAFKPAESGCRRGPDGLEPADAMALRAAAGGWQSLQEVCPYRFEPAVAPGVAADAAGVTIDIQGLVSAVAQTSADLALVEGAGGWLVPLGRNMMIADLAVAFGAPVVIVGRCGLGTINHSLLTIEAVRARGLQVAGLVLCDAEGGASRDATEQNAREIHAVSAVPLLGVFPYVPGCSASDLATVAVANLALDLLWP